MTVKNAPNDSTLTLHAAVIGGIRCADDYQVIWRGMSIGRIVLASGLPSDKPAWSWNCYVHGRPCRANESGTGASLDDCARGRPTRCGPALSEML
jgi:hypothetical protein